MPEETIAVEAEEIHDSVRKLALILRDLIEIALLEKHTAYRNTLSDHQAALEEIIGDHE
jgi:hypothetical protein